FDPRLLRPVWLPVTPPRLMLATASQPSLERSFRRRRRHRERRPFAALRFAEDLAIEPKERIVKPIHHAFFQRNDAVVRDVDMFRPTPGATFGDVAWADVERVLEEAEPVHGVERMHIQARDADQEARPAKRFPSGSRGARFAFHLVLAEHVADVLAKEALDAL